MNFDNAMRRQVYSIPNLIKTEYEDLEPKTRKVLSTPEIFSIQRIILTGCGDSYVAAMATKHAFELLTKIPTEVVSAIDLARLYDSNQLGFAPYNPLVISVSNSGGVARVAEAIARCTKKGAMTLAITGNEESILAKNSVKVLKLDIPAFENAPGTRSYMVSVLALLLMAIRIGEVRGRYSMDEAMDMRYDIGNQADMLEKMLPKMDGQILEIAKTWKNFEAFDFVGTGFDLAAASFGKAKTFEAAGKYAMEINSEEWLHLNFFMRNSEKIGTVVVANTTNPAHSRNKELVKYAKLLGRPLLVITDGNASNFNDEVVDYVQTPKSKYQIMMPLTQFAPLSLLMGYVGEMIGEVDGRGCAGRWEFCKGGACVKNSEMIIFE